MADSNTRKKAGKVTKPAKPLPDFPLFPHDSGRWAKKIRKKFHFFGRWAKMKNGTLVEVEDMEASAREALNKFNREWPYLKEGREVPTYLNEGWGASEDFCTMQSLCNSFWRTKREKLLCSELSARMFREYEETTDLLIDFFGKERRVDDIRPDEFGQLRSQLAKRYGTHGLKNSINRCRIVFKYAFDNRMISQPVAYGQSFARPSAKQMRKARNEAGTKLFEREELLSILDACDRQMKAMVLLGLNCGFGNTDVASLPQSALDLKDGWVDFPRPKTEIRRRAKLWPETLKALKTAIAKRTTPSEQENADLCFLTAQGNKWVRVKEQIGEEGETKYTPLDSLGQKFKCILKRNRCPACGALQSEDDPKACQSCKKTPKEWGKIERKGISFYTLRHVFETIGGESRDQVAVNAIMGHVDSSMAAIYRERISDERLETVADTVRQWLFGDAK